MHKEFPTTVYRNIRISLWVIRYTSYHRVDNIERMNCLIKILEFNL